MNNYIPTVHVQRLPSTKQISTHNSCWSCVFTLLLKFWRFLERIRRMLSISSGRRGRLWDRGSTLTVKCGYSHAFSQFNHLMSIFSDILGVEEVGRSRGRGKRNSITDGHSLCFVFLYIWDSFREYQKIPELCHKRHWHKVKTCFLTVTLAPPRLPPAPSSPAPDRLWGCWSEPGGPHGSGNDGGTSC